MDVTAIVDNAVQAHPDVHALRRAGIRVLTHPLPPVLWRRLRRRFLRDRTRLACDFDELLPGARPALAVLSTGGCLVENDFLDICTARGWPFVTIGQANFEGWWPYDDSARRYREALPLARRCYFVSEGNWRLAEKQVGSQIENGEVIRNPFNVSYDAAPPWPRMGNDDEVRLACVGRLHPTSKGQDILLEALAHPDWVGRPWRLTFYGDGPCRDGVERMVRHFGLQDRVGFAGYVAEVERIWAESHALVMPSRFEGLPLAMVEAMLCARPVVTTDVAGHREIVEDGVSGFIADAPTPTSFRQALDRLWARRADLEEIGKIAAQGIRAKVPPNPIEIFTKKIKEHSLSSSGSGA
jgi:glycosyltransferase involved in cell wall biosynthesis